MALYEFAPIGVLLLVALGVSALILVLSRWMGPYKPTTRKREPYESGMNPIGPANRRYSVKFYLVAVLFILFDIEVVFFLPWAVVFRETGLYGFLVMAVFVVVLSIGLIYEWRVGALEWE
ncbi:MAG: NADH-quinone oxidoreductase subunit A [Anaerolineae bacterium]